MRRSLVLLTLLAACGSSGDGAPADSADAGGPSLSVECGLLPLLVETGELCRWGEASVCNTAGRWNLRAGPEYISTLKVQNQLAAGDGDTDAASITLTGVKVELLSVGDKALALPKLSNPYDLVFPDVTPIAPGSTGRLGTVIVPEAYAALLREREADPDTALGKLVASITVKGKTGSGKTVESPAFRWPIRLTYTSPVLGDDECDAEIAGACSGLIGIDGSSELCLCPDPRAGPGDRSCDLDL